MDIEKLEIINLLSNYDSEDITKIMIVMTYWKDMIDNGIVDENDIDNLSNLSQEKQDNIKNFISNKIASQIERNNNGNKEQKEKEL